MAICIYEENTFYLNQKSCLTHDTEHFSKICFWLVSPIWLYCSTNFLFLQLMITHSFWALKEPRYTLAGGIGCGGGGGVGCGGGDDCCCCSGGSDTLEPFLGHKK